MISQNFIFFGVLMIRAFISHSAAQDIILRDVLDNPAALKARGAFGHIVAKKLRRLPVIQKLNGPENIPVIDKPSDATDSLIGEKSTDTENNLTDEKSIDAENKLDAEKSTDAENTLTGEKSIDADDESTAEKSNDISDNDLTTDETGDTENRKFSLGKLVKKVTKNKLVRKVVGGAAEAIGFGATQCAINSGC